MAITYIGLVAALIACTPLTAAFAPPVSLSGWRVARTCRCVLPRQRLSSRCVRRARCQQHGRAVLRLPDELSTTRLCPLAVRAGHARCVLKCPRHLCKAAADASCLRLVLRCLCSHPAQCRPTRPASSRRNARPRTDTFRGSRRASLRSRRGTARPLRRRWMTWCLP